jgi:hypothetical protein
MKIQSILKFIWCSGFLGLSLQTGWAQKLPEKVSPSPGLSSNYRVVSRLTNKDYDLNWAEIPTSEMRVFIPEMRCNLNLRYHELAKKPGFRLPPSEEVFPGDPKPTGVLPWPRLQGFWQDWADGIYLSIEQAIEETETGEKKDFMIVKVYSMCTEELLAESSVLIKNPQLNRELRIPTLNYSLLMNVEQTTLKVRDFQDHPPTDEIELELHYVEPLTKEARRSVFRAYRFL